ncbi:hypothetical protein [Streptomyces adustus]|uniref:hypothetical protein n=1 Tax=Streptomyces adustus TaxID=1609272 RepID=UPI003711FB78
MAVAGRERRDLVSYEVEYSAQLHAGRKVLRVALAAAAEQVTPNLSELPTAPVSRPMPARPRARLREVPPGRKRLRPSPVPDSAMP